LPLIFKLRVPPELTLPSPWRFCDGDHAEKSLHQQLSYFCLRLFFPLLASASFFSPPSVFVYFSLPLASFWRIWKNFSPSNTLETVPPPPENSCITSGSFPHSRSSPRLELLLFPSSSIQIRSSLIVFCPLRSFFPFLALLSHSLSNR